MTTTQTLRRKLEKAAPPPHMTARDATLRAASNALSNAIYEMCPTAFIWAPPDGPYLYAYPEHPCADWDEVTLWLTRCATQRMTDDDAILLANLPRAAFEVLGVTPVEYARHMLAVFDAMIPSV